MINAKIKRVNKTAVRINNFMEHKCICSCGNEHMTPNETTNCDYCDKDIDLDTETFYPLSRSQEEIDEEGETEFQDTPFCSKCADRIIWKESEILKAYNK